MTNLLDRSAVPTPQRVRAGPPTSHHRPSMQMLRTATILALVAGTTATDVGAQGTIRGVLHDSLRSAAPIAGAEVALLGANRRVTTDAQGRFEFTGVSVGKAVVAFWAPWLDSLALPAMQAELQVGSGSTTELRLATPSRAAYQRAVCGAPLDAGAGILIGEVRNLEGAPLAGVPVGARWTETVFAAGKMERSTVATLDTANASGFYRLCGVPIDAEVSLVAATDEVRSGDLTVGLAGSPVRRRDLTVAPASAVARVRGVVIGPDSQPMAGATVALHDDSARVARTDAQGRFLLEGVPRRSGQLLIRALGFSPRVESLEPYADDIELEPVAIERLPPELAAVNVTAERGTLAKLAFDERRKSGLGSFVTDSMLANAPQVNSAVVASFLPRVALQSTRRGPMIMMRRGMEFCRPRFFLDGLWMGTVTAEEEQDAFRRAKRVESYTANEMPAQFNDFSGCGAVVIWTR